MDGWMDGRTDGWTDRQTVRQTVSVACYGPSILGDPFKFLSYKNCKTYESLISCGASSMGRPGVTMCCLGCMTKIIRSPCPSGVLSS